MLLCAASNDRFLAGYILPEPGPMISYTPACFRTGYIWLKPDQAIRIGSRSVLHHMIRDFFERTEPNGMREVGSGIFDPVRVWQYAGRNDHN